MLQLSELFPRGKLNDFHCGMGKNIETSTVNLYVSFFSRHSLVCAYVFCSVEFFILVRSVVSPAHTKP